MLFLKKASLICTHTQYKKRHGCTLLHRLDNIIFQEYDVASSEENPTIYVTCSKKKI